MINLEVKIGRMIFKNPVSVASGCYGNGREYNDIYDINRLGAIVTKSVTLKPRVGNVPPRIWETECGMLNAIGLANPGLESFIKTEIPFLSKLETNVIVSVSGGAIEEYIQIVEKLNDFDCIDGFELNVSCPNVKHGGMAFGKNPAIVADLVESIRKITLRTLIVKLTPNVTDIAEVGEAAVEAGADCLAAINTILGMDFDIRTRKPILGNITGGLSGPAIKPVALARVFELRKALPETPIIGIGGIAKPEDAICHLLAGADAVQVGSGQFPRPLLPIEIIDYLPKYCEEYGFTGVSRIKAVLDAG